MHRCCSCHLYNALRVLEGTTRHDHYHTRGTYITLFSTKLNLLPRLIKSSGHSNLGVIVLILVPYLIPCL